MKNIFGEETFYILVTNEEDHHKALKLMYDNGYLHKHCVTKELTNDYYWTNNYSRGPYAICIEPFNMILGGGIQGGICLDKYHHHIWYSENLIEEINELKESVKFNLL